MISRSAVFSPETVKLTLIFASLALASAKELKEVSMRKSFYGKGEML